MVPLNLYQGQFLSISCPAAAYLLTPPLRIHPSSTQISTGKAELGFFASKLAVSSTDLKASGKKLKSRKQTEGAHELGHATSVPQGCSLTELQGLNSDEKQMRQSWQQEGKIKRVL